MELPTHPLYGHWNSVEYQRQRILQALCKGPCSTWQLKTEDDCYDPPRRIMELRALGYDIVTERQKIRTPHGEHRVGIYVLPAKPGIRRKTSKTRQGGSHAKS